MNSIVVGQTARKTFLQMDPSCSIRVVSHHIAASSKHESEKTVSWIDKISVKQDLRYRHEMIEEEYNEVRHRHRFRYRFFIGSKLNSRYSLGFQLATGSSDPTSTNQSFDNAFSTKDIWIDLGYFTVRPKPKTDLVLTGGKFTNPFILSDKSEIMWDSDLNPEGLALSFDHLFINLEFMLRGAYFWIEERSSDSDSKLYAGQAAMKYVKQEQELEFMFGGGYFYFDNIKGFPGLYDSENSYGNSANQYNQYIYEYILLEFFAAFSFSEWILPLELYGDYVTNTEVSKNSDGWILGINIGKLDKLYSWNLRYNYRNLEKEAVIGVFTDSDFGGGGTNAEGHEVGIAVLIDEHLKGSVTYFINTIDLDLEKKYRRLQVDLIFKF
jgi:hypothetical protein